MDDSISIESDQTDDVVVCSPTELRRRGLRLVNYTKKRLRKAKTKKNNERFVGHFGASPSVIAQMWEDLQTTTVERAHVHPDMLGIDAFSMTMHHLKRHPTELEREATFDINEKTGRKKIWPWAERLQALKEEKIFWPEDCFEHDRWVMSVDGVHFWIEEPTHPTLSFDTKCHSHKCAHAGLCHELGISLSSNHLVWMNGPFEAGPSDNKTFQKKGLKAKLSEKGKMAMADGGCPGHPTLLSAPNYHDAKPIKLFKSRALKRHKKFNDRIKHFDCSKGHFCHNQDRFQICVKAVCVMCQHKLEMGDPLHDIPTEAAVNAE